MKPGEGTNIRQRGKIAFVFPLLAHGYAWAEGSAEGIFNLFLYAMGAFTILWCIVTGVVFWAARKLPLLKRIATTALVFFLPCLALGIVLVYDFGVEFARSTSVEVASKPVVVANVTFPVGSTVTYRRDSIWHRHPIAASTKETLSLYALRIHGLKIDESFPAQVTVTLAGSQEIDGWRCSDNESAYLLRIDSAPVLRSCLLVGQTVDHIAWPEGTLLSESSPEEWGVAWFSQPRSVIFGCEDGFNVFGLPLHQASARFDRNHRMLSFDGTTCNTTLRLGKYAVHPFAWVQAEPDGTMKILNQEREVESGKAIPCLQVDKNRNVKKCDARTASDTPE